MSKIYPYAGFWKRAIAFLIDGIILSIPMALFAFLVMGTQVMSIVKLASSNIEPSPDMLLPVFGKWMLGIVAVWAFNVILLWLYHAIMESGKHQATIGKMALGIKVVGVHGQRISFARATGRTFGKFISHMILYFGDYMAGFTQHRQALHDLMAATYVVDKNYQEGQELPALRFSTGGLIASILAALAPIVLYIGTIVLTMALAISDLKDDPDMQDLWKELSSTESISQDPELKNLFNDATRSLNLASAQAEIDRFVQSHTVLNEPVEKEGITYSQSLEGYKASFKDSNGNEYEVLQRPGEFWICCLKGPGGTCGNDDVYKPCKASHAD